MIRSVSWCLSLIALLVLGGYKLTSADKSTSTEDLVSSIVSTACAANLTVLGEFYVSVRRSYTSVQNIQYPIFDLSGPLPDDDLDSVASSVIASIDRGEHEINLYYDGFYQMFSYFSQFTEELFEWCIHLLSPDDEPIYGCIRGDNRSGTERFEQLGLFDYINYYSSAFPYSLKLTLTGEHTIVLQDALVTCTFYPPWQNETIGAYYAVSVTGGNSFEITSFPDQEDTFLTRGERRVFSADVFVTQDVSRIVWYKGDVPITRVIDVRDTNCTQVGGFGNCTDTFIPTTYSILSFDADLFASCEFGFEYVTENQRYLLSFNSASANDTGEFHLHVNGDIEKSFSLSVVFIEFPFEVRLPLGNSSTLLCALKAPPESVVYWLFNDEPVESMSLICSETSIFTEELEGENFSMFYSHLKLCNITRDNVGRYSCVVEYNVSLPTDKVYKAHQDVDATTYIPRTTPEDMLVGPNAQDNVIIGASLGAVVIILIVAAALVVFLIVWIKYTAKRKRRRTLKHRPSKHLLLKPHLLKGDAYIDLCSPDIKKGGELEFPRQSLELVVELAHGKFGRVFKAKAHGMVSSLPHVNTVAVKTTLNSDSLGEDCRLLNELELLKKLYRQPHRNICNLLGHCTETSPLYLILEFACHGNLKKYLVSCRQALLNRGQEVLIDRSTISASTQPQEAGEFHQVHVLASATNPLKVQLNGLPVESKDLEKSPPSPDSPFTAPGLLKETQLCEFAHQIACGLKHLADMNIVHCDLAARNILVAEKGVLKIGDFGMARESTEAEPQYQNLQIENEDTMVPAKWAAPELLDRRPHSMKSDIWSFGVILWEMASYGGEPFSHFRVGASLDPFLKYLQEGNRLAKPAGLSNYLYRQLCSCWSLDPKSRPCAEELIEFFENVDPNTMALEDMLEEVTV